MSGAAGSLSDFSRSEDEERTRDELRMFSAPAIVYYSIVLVRV
jgi:hypothetical protein